MTRLGLVRHGETEWNKSGRLQGRADVPLNARGRWQAQALVPVVAGGGWDVVVSSPLLRAAETAEIIVRGTGLTTAPSCELLLERAYGAAEGMAIAGADARWPGGAYPGLEELDALAERGMQAVRHLRGTWPERSVLIVCHGALIRSTAALLCGTPVPRILNGTLTVLEKGPTKWRVLDPTST